MSASAHIDRPQRAGGDAAGGRALVIGLAVAVLVGVGVGFALGSATKSNSHSVSSTLAPAITVAHAHVASVPAYAAAVLPALRTSSPKPAHALAGHAAGHPSSSETTSSTSVPPVTSTATSQAPPVEKAPVEQAHPVEKAPPPVEKSSGSQPKHETEQVHSGSGGA
ncbi:MAG TPA: hypothetical protein VNV42_02550 [Solirubrobacteraceae bacterium]|jgi:hypothetical protein|nr:hypothetical protein [Solirubrobacteraceae bacterium]